MPFEPQYHESSASRQDIENTQGPVLLEFGTNWCGYCQAFSPHVKQLLDQFPQVQHIRVEDGKGKTLGRAFRVKLWPTLIFLRDGQLIAQLARPSAQEAEQAMHAITGPDDQPPRDDASSH